jgi:curli biogenesis system outer membrane secretion channel CsgG
MRQSFGGTVCVRAVFVTTSLLLSACATPAKVPQAVALPTPLAVALPQAPTHEFKRKIAVGRFTNETRYGRALLTGDELDPLGRQVSDILSARLTDTGRFLVFERPDLNVVKGEQQLTGEHGNIVGVDMLLVGSLTGFGRDVAGESGFFSNTKKQVAQASVDIRLIDVHTASVLFAATGHGEASLENGTVLGFGNQAGYAGSLNDKAIAAAISDVMTPLVSQMTQRDWRTDILKVEGSQVFISGGTHQGLKPGDRLTVMRSGGSARSGQTGFDIPLPPTQVGVIQVRQTFGEDETTEGSVCDIVQGSLPSKGSAGLFVVGKPGA